jgi:hypothetical protein
MSNNSNNNNNKRSRSSSAAAAAAAAAAAPAAIVNDTDNNNHYVDDEDDDDDDDEDYDPDVHPLEEDPEEEDEVFQLTEGTSLQRTHPRHARRDPSHKLNNNNAFTAAINPYIVATNFQQHGECIPNINKSDGDDHDHDHDDSSHSNNEQTKVNFISSATIANMSPPLFQKLATYPQDTTVVVNPIVDKHVVDNHIKFDAQVMQDGIFAIPSVLSAIKGMFSLQNYISHIHIYIHSYIHTYIHTYIHMYRHTDIHTQTTKIHIHNSHTCIHTKKHTSHITETLVWFTEIKQ